MDPDREDERAERGRALIARAVEQTYAPHALREELGRASGRDARRRRRRGIWAPPLAAAAVVALAVVVVSRGAPTVAEAATAAHKAPEHAAPAVDRADPAVLRAEEGGIYFPTWRAFGWRATGARDDRIGGRDVTTVFYAGDAGGRLAYSIVDGKSLQPPDGVTRTVGGIRVTVLRHDGRRMVTWERDGRTCIVVASPEVPLDTLLALPAWE